MSYRRRVASIAQEQHDRKRQQAQYFSGAQSVLAEDFQDLREKRNAGAKKNHADDIELIDAFAIVRQVAINEIQTEEADRHVDEENHPPVKKSNDEAAGYGAQHRADECRDGDKAHGADEFEFGEGSNHGQATDRHHHRPAAALKNTAKDKHVDARRDSAKDRSDREHADRRGKNPAGSVAIRHPAAHGDEDREAQGIAGENRFHTERRHLERFRDRRHCRVQDGRVERLHKYGYGDQPRQKSLDGIVGRILGRH